MANDLRKLVLSIKPEYAEAIFSGEKTVEYRKQCPRDGTNGVYIHVCGENPLYVQGYAGCHGFITGEPRSVWEATNEVGGLTEKEFFDYFAGAQEAHAIQLFGAMRLVNPIPLQVLGLTRPPQSLAYAKGMR